VAIPCVSPSSGGLARRAFAGLSSCPALRLPLVGEYERTLESFIPQRRPRMKSTGAPAARRGPRGVGRLEDWPAAFDQVSARGQADVDLLLAELGGQRRPLRHLGARWVRWCEHRRQIGLIGLAGNEGRRPSAIGVIAHGAHPAGKGGRSRKMTCAGALA